MTGADWIALGLVLAALWYAIDRFNLGNRISGRLILFLIALAATETSIFFFQKGSILGGWLFAVAAALQFMMVATGLFRLPEWWRRRGG